MLPIPIYWSLLVVSCGYALVRGGTDERTIGLACIVASVVSLLTLSPRQMRYSDVELGLLLVDGATLAVFAAIALHSSRFWPLWITGLQLTTSVAHLFKAADFNLIPHAYAAAERFWSYPILFILAVGTWRSQQRKTITAAAG